MSSASRNCLFIELAKSKQLFDQILAKQIESTNFINKRNRVDIISQPTSTALKTCFYDFSSLYVSDFEKDHPNITPAEITGKIDPWPIFVEYALRIYCSQLGPGVDEKLLLRLLLLVIFTLVKKYDFRYTTPDIPTLDNYIDTWKKIGPIAPQDLKEHVNYLTNQIAAKMP